MKLIERFSWLVIAGRRPAGLHRGGNRDADTAVKPWIDANAPSLHYIAPAVGVVIVVAVGMWLMRRNGSAATH